MKTAFIFILESEALIEVTVANNACWTLRQGFNYPVPKLNVPVINQNKFGLGVDTFMIIAKVINVRKRTTIIGCQ